MKNVLMYFGILFCVIPSCSMEDSVLFRHFTELEDFAESSISEQIEVIDNSLLCIDGLRAEIDRLSNNKFISHISSLQSFSISLKDKSAELRSMLTINYDLETWSSAKHTLLEIYYEITNIVRDIISLDIDETKSRVSDCLFSIYKCCNAFTNGFPSFRNDATISYIIDIIEKYSSLPLSPGKSMKILCFGNSFTQDCMGYVPFILKNVAPDVNLTIGIGYIGGASLAQQLASISGEIVDNYKPSSYYYHKYEANATKWVDKSNLSVDDILAEEKWDVITFQQSGGENYLQWDIYFMPYICPLHKIIMKKLNYPVKFGYIMTHSSYSKDSDTLLSKYNAITQNAEKIHTYTLNEVLFPYATAIQNARMTELDILGDGGHLMADIAHLHDGIPCLIACYSNVMTILNLLHINKSVVGDTTTVTKNWISERNIPSPHYGCFTQDVVGVTDENRTIAQICAVMSSKYPYKLSYDINCSCEVCYE